MNQNAPTNPVTPDDPNVLDWHEIKNFGIDPAPAGLSEDDQSQQS